MKKAIPLLLTILFTLALAGNELTNATPKIDTKPIKLYYGTIGSNDYIWGTTTVSNPTDAWMFHSEMPERLMDNACATNGTHVYVVSGYNTTYPTRLFRHAVGSTTWEQLTPPPMNITNGGCAIIGDTLYYCSGHTYTGTPRSIDTLFKYSISGNNWTGAPGPFTGTTYNWQPSILACQGKVYFISGCNQPGSTAPTTQVWAYTPGSGWAQVASMNQGRVFAAGWVYHDTIWVTGGNANNVALTHSEFYDPVANVWTVNNSIFPALPVGVWGAASGIVSNTGFVFSGVSPAGALRDTTNYFDHNTHTWSTNPSVLLKVYRGTGVGNADNKAVIYGGSTGSFNATDTCQYESFGGGLDHDVGVNQILAPGSVIPSTPLAPRAEIKNFGTNPESDIPVYCWIDSAGTRVYNQSFTYPGPLAPNATAEVTFSPNWTPGGDGATYQVTMFTDLSGDENHANDTMRQTTTISSTVFSDTIIVRRTALDAPVIDGQIRPGEWNPSLAYDVSDIAGRSGTPRPPGSSIMYFLYNDSFVYLANDIPAIAVRGNYDQFGAYVDEDRSGTWSRDSSEGNHWIEYVGGDSVVFRALLSTAPQVWRMPGQCPGCLSVSSTISGHLQIEAMIPIGTDKGDWNISPGDTVGYFQYTAQAPGNIYWGWWPQSLIMANWSNPAYYGTMIFSPTPSIAEDGKIDASYNTFCNIYPNPIRDFARIHFSIVKSANVELTIYDITGKAVRTLISGLVEPGNHYVKWDRTNDNGARVANGAYFYRLTIAGKSFVGKSIILK
ncbi:MAG: T9SS type A sorting domain-containing protein [candidate division WOR-3 bacterium]|nr:T9SS type A sorting domain-containing protein [candidate division WOR-3 bacterium]